MVRPELGRVSQGSWRPAKTLTREEYIEGEVPNSRQNGMPNPNTGGAVIVTKIASYYYSPRMQPVRTFNYSYAIQY